MKKIFKLLLLTLLLFNVYDAHAVYVERMPVNQIQPNGDTLHFFVTGDECYHRFHDADNFTIVQDHAGYWVYAMPASNGGLQPSSYRVGTVSPAAVGLRPGLTITKDEWIERRNAWEIPAQYRRDIPKTSGRNHGDYCNLVLFIRFADDSSYSRSLSSIDKMFSDSTTATSSSVYNFFKRVSYNKLFVRTHYAPAPNGDAIRSYQSPHPRGYYMPYNDDNPDGYTNYEERTNREFELLVNAVQYVNDSFPIPNDYVLDCDNDGYIDNMNFVVKGTYTGWSDLLWPHKWNLYGYNVYINGKQVNTFNFALEGAGANYFGTSTFCHEMFHSLGAPDLYHYNTGTDVSPVGSWDLMAGNANPPQHMSAYMKYKYGNWLDSIPTITTPGTYTLYSVGDSMPEGNIIYRIPSSDPNQFYVLEYRDNTEPFETKLSGRGLLIYRIDSRFDGNAGYDGYANFDEMWIFRPGSSSNNETGQLSEAFFAPNRHRTEFSPSTDPHPYLTDNSRDLSISITNITTPGNTIKFHYSDKIVPCELKHNHTTTSTATLSWLGNAEAYRISYRHQSSDEPYATRLTHTNHITLTGLEANEQYEWTVRALYTPLGDDTYADSSALPTAAWFHTEMCNNSITDSVVLPYEPRIGIPFANNKTYNYSQQIYHSNEIGGAKNIGTISLHYQHTTPLSKSNCTIYLANTTINEFNDTINPLALEYLTPVYSGALYFVQGWNEIVLDTPFYYNGTDNLIIAIDDNSGEPSRAGNKFYVHETDHFYAINYSSSSENPGPEQGDSILGDRSRMSFRNNIKFTGCPINADHYYVCVISDNEEQGRVSGEGYYLPNETIQIHAFPFGNNTFLQWDDGTTDNPRAITITQDTLFVAYFKSPLGISGIEAQGGYVVLTKHLQLTVSGADNLPVSIYDLMGRRIESVGAHHAAEVTFNVPQRGIYLVSVGNNKPAKVFVN